jgi:type II secretory pathway component PulF
MIQNIYTCFILYTEYSTKENKRKQKKTKEKTHTKKEKTLFFVQLSICSKTSVSLIQSRHYTTSTITDAI